MTAFFARLRDRPTAYKALVLFGYGVLTFLAIYYIGTLFLGNFVFFRVFEFLWFMHIVIICTQIYRSQTELFLLALCGLLPGIFNNLLGLFTL